MRGAEFGRHMGGDSAERYQCQSTSDTAQKSVAFIQLCVYCMGSFTSFCTRFCVARQSDILYSQLLILLFPFNDIADVGK